MKNINAGPLGSSSNCLSFVKTKRALIFPASDGMHGEEPWKSDGTAVGTKLVKDISPGVTAGGTPKSSEPCGFTRFHGRTFFSARAAGYGNELWKSDGTGPGTRPCQGRQAWRRR